MERTRKAFCWLLCLLMLAPGLLSCADSDTPLGESGTAGDTAAESTETAPAETDPRGQPDNLP